LLNNLKDDKGKIYMNYTDKVSSCYHKSNDDRPPSK